MCLSRVHCGSTPFSLPLKDRKEVLHFKRSVLSQVSAVQAIADLVQTELCTQALGAQHTPELWVQRSTQLTERFHWICTIPVCQLEGQAWPAVELLNQGVELARREDTLVHLEELCSRDLVELEQLRCGDVKVFLHTVHHQAPSCICQQVRLHNAQGGVAPHITLANWERSAKEKSNLLGCCFRCITAVACVECVVGAKSSADAGGGLSTRPV
mmetsp:Transcript_15274/g.26465  ORF Transcript_15274/g.26465 Transcript_15274/m.26465 type:complete len:213 (-) Transcript_15274:597-1235(-)